MDLKKSPSEAQAFNYLVFLGTFGFHQFYLGNKKRGLYLLITCGMSHLMLLFSPAIFPLLRTHYGSRWAFILLLSGYILSTPVLLWDFIKLSNEVAKKRALTDNSP